jgi:uncharacterized SAM-binding protein YcdF (DUF218 family)
MSDSPNTTAIKSPRSSWMRRIYRSIKGLCTFIGLVTVLAITTPLVHWWAIASSGPVEQPKGDILIVLSAARDQNGGMSFSSYWRARQAVDAWKSGGFTKVVVSGARVSAITQFLIAEGVPSDSIIIEGASTSTHQNAINTARLIQNMPGKRVLLTSDFHMYRALRTFRKAGIDAAPMAVPDAIRNSEEWGGRFSVLQNLILENLKIIDYKIHGWI